MACFGIFQLQWGNVFQGLLQLNQFDWLIVKRVGYFVFQFGQFEVFSAGDGRNPKLGY